MLRLSSGRSASYFRHRLSPLLNFSSLGGADDQSSSSPSKSSPPPIRVGFTDTAGRGIFATRRIGAGELIHTAKPVVCHPTLCSLHSVCYFCLKKLPAINCDDVQFCSYECEAQSASVQFSKRSARERGQRKITPLYVCQSGNWHGFHEVEKRADWSVFNDYCQAQGLKYPFLAKRFACLVLSGVADATSLDILQPATLTSEMLFLVEKEFDLLRSTLHDADITTEQLACVLTRIRINAFRIELTCGFHVDLLSSAAAAVEAEASVGNAVYMLPSFYNHDCDPNSHILWLQNADARVKALRDIESGEELRICYIDASMDCDARKAILSKGFGFNCNCLRCSSGD